jgi:hypothetical protein
MSDCSASRNEDFGALKGLCNALGFGRAQRAVECRKVILLLDVLAEISHEQSQNRKERGRAGLKILEDFEFSLT